jgi:hypothetical protein
MAHDDRIQQILGKKGNKRAVTYLRSINGLRRVESKLWGNVLSFSFVLWKAGNFWCKTGTFFIWFTENCGKFV